MRLSGALRAAAVFEAAKGAVVLLAGFGVLALLHRDAQALAERLVAHAHLNPAAGYPRIFIDLASRLTDGRLLLAAAGAALYASVRFAEAYGLWRARRWAEWLAALSSGIYVPFELAELHGRVGWIAIAALGLNVAVFLVAVVAVTGKTQRH